MPALYSNSSSSSLNSFSWSSTIDLTKRMLMVIRTLLPDQFYLRKVQSYIFIMHFLNSPILYEKNTCIDFGFLIKEDF